MLRLEKGRYYIGATTQIERRFAQHKAGKGATFTTRYPPVEIVETIPCDTNDYELAALVENEKTIEYAKVHGTWRVRGGEYCTEKLLRDAMGIPSW